MDTEKKIVHKIEEGMDPQDVLCTTYQMRNFYAQRDSCTYITGIPKGSHSL